MTPTRQAKEEFTVDYFIQKFSAIPDELWGCGRCENGGRRCALGHCGTDTLRVWKDYNAEIQALGNLMQPLEAPEDAGNSPDVTVHLINDGQHKAYQQDTPKARILAALEQIKAKATL